MRLLSRRNSQQSAYAGLPQLSSFLSLPPGIPVILFFCCSCLLSCSSGTFSDDEGARAVLLKATELNYPSGSALKYHQGKLYLMGDDASQLLVLDTSFREIKRVQVSRYTAARISKTAKADIEAMDIIQDDAGNAQLLMLGSGSVSPSRDSLIKLDLNTSTRHQYSGSKAYERIKRRLPELNLEGAAVINQTLLLSNRGNLSHPQNYLIITTQKFPESGEGSFRILPLNTRELHFGVSGLDYYAPDDLLLITFSSEATSSASADGEIGSSALALIRDISAKLDRDKLEPDAWISLPETSKRFTKMKIESVAAGEKEDGALIVYLTSDNDDGKSSLFKIRLLL